MSRFSDDREHQRKVKHLFMHLCKATKQQKDSTFARKQVHKQVDRVKQLAVQKVGKEALEQEISRLKRKIDRLLATEGRLQAEYEKDEQVQREMTARLDELEDKLHNMERLLEKKPAGMAHKLHKQAHELQDKIDGMEQQKKSREERRALIEKKINEKLAQKKGKKKEVTQHVRKLENMHKKLKKNKKHDPNMLKRIGERIKKLKAKL